MADILSSVSVVLGADISAFKASMAAAKKELRGLTQAGEAMKDIGASLSASISAPLLALTGVSLKLAGDMEKANVNFEVMLGSAEKAGKVLADLKQFAASTPFEFPEVQAAAKKLLAFNTPAEELKETLRQLGDVSAGIDAPIGEIAELFGKARVQGRLFQEDINQLTGRGIPIIQELAKQFKVSDSEVRKLVESGKVGFPNLQQAFADLTGEGGKFAGLMAKQSQTLPGLLSTAFDEVKGLATDIGTEIVNAFDLKGALQGFSSFIAGVRETFAGLSPEVKKIALVLGGVAIAVGPVLVGLGTLLTVLAPLKGAFLALSGPIGLTVLAIGAAAALIIANWSDIVAYFTTGEGGRVFQELSRAVSEAMTNIKAAISALTGSVGSDFGELVSGANILSSVFTTAFKSVAAGITAFADLVSGLVRTVTGLLNQDWAKAWDGAKQVVLGMYAPLANLLGLDYSKFKDFLGVQGDGGQSGVSQYFKGLTQNVGGFLAVTPFATAAMEEFKKAASQPTAPLINEDQVKALEKIREGLQQVTNEVKAGINFDPLNDKIKVLSSGIPSLLAAGFAPNGKVVGAFVSQLRGLEGEYEKFAARIAAKQAELGGLKPEKFSYERTTELPQTLPFDGSFAEKAKVAAAAYAAAMASLKPAQLAATEAQATFNTEMEGLLDQMNAAVGPLVGDLAIQFSTAFGDMITGVSSAGDAFKGLFSGILQSIAGFMGTFGKQLIAIGIGKIGLDKLFASGPAGGPAAIAAGLGLVALAGVAASLAKSSASNLGKITGGGSLAPPAPRSLAPAAAAPRAGAVAPAPVTVTHIIEMVQRGSDLVGVIQIEQNRRTRTLGGG